MFPIILSASPAYAVKKDCSKQPNIFKFLVAVYFKIAESDKNTMTL